MNTELEEIPEDAGRPVALGDLYALEKRLSHFVAAQANETRTHFDVVAENIHKDVAGANQDEISYLRDKVVEHEERLSALEPSF